MMKWVVAAAMGLAAVSIGGTAQAAGDPVHGKVVFNQCRVCHSLEAGHKGVGPSLHGLFGRPAGTTDFAYSPSMKRSGIVWSEEALKSYLPNPQAKVPGTKMLFMGLTDPKDVDDVIAYLQEATK